MLFLLAVMTGRPLLPPVLAMLAIAVALTLAVDDAFGWLFAWAGSAATVRLGPTGAKAWAAITALAAATIALADPDAALFWGVTAAVSATSALWLLIGGLMRANEALREARAELAEMAVAEERLRFARDLHDLLGHDLSLIALKAELARKLLPARAGEAAPEVEQIRELTRSALARSARRSTATGGRRCRASSRARRWRSRPPASSSTSTRPTAARSRGRGRARLGRARGRDQRHPPQRRQARRDHGRAGTARPSSRSPTTAAARPPHDAGGHGLTGLRERVQSVGGTVEAGAGPGGGFRCDGASARGVIRVLLAEDQAMVRGALASLLGLEHDIEVVAEVGRGDEVLAAARRAAPDVALLDIGMPGLDGLEVAAAPARRAARRCAS